MQVVSYKGRGAIVTNWRKLAANVPGAKVTPLDMAMNLHVLEFKSKINNLPGIKWAEFWLKKGDKRAKNIGTNVPVPAITKETKFTAREAKRAFNSQISSCEAKRKKKIKMVGGLFNHSAF